MTETDIRDGTIMIIQSLQHVNMNHVDRRSDTVDEGSVDHIDSRVISSDAGESDRTGCGASSKR